MVSSTSTPSASGKKKPSSGSSAASSSVSSSSSSSVSSSSISRDTKEKSTVKQVPDASTVWAPVSWWARSSDVIYVWMHVFMGVVGVVLSPISALAFFQHRTTIMKFVPPSYFPIPSALLSFVQAWAKLVDPIYNSNPAWLAAEEVMNVVFCGPVHLLTALAFLLGWNAIRVVATVNNVFTIYQVVMLVTETTARGTNYDQIAFLLTYIAYGGFALLSLIRLNMKMPFSGPNKRSRSEFWNGAATVLFIILVGAMGISAARFFVAAGYFSQTQVEGLSPILGFALRFARSL